MKNSKYKEMIEYWRKRALEAEKKLADNAANRR